MFRRLIVSFFLDKEVSALKSRLAEASDALKRIENSVLAIDEDAPKEVRVLAAKVLNHVLHSADQIRTKTGGFVHTFEAEAYLAYNKAKQDDLSTLAYAHKLIDKTKIFF
jgi:hypothetical protein